MDKIILVLKNEFITTVTRRSFLITLFLVPVVGLVVSIVISMLGNSTGQVVSRVFGAPPKNVVEGYVDESRIIHAFPDKIQPGRFVAYPNQEEGRQALQQGKIEALYVVPQSYLQDGKIYSIRPDFNPLSGFDQADAFSSLIQYNLLREDPQLTRLVSNPIDVQKISLSPEPQREQDNMLTFFLPYAVTMIFYVVILTASGLMLNSLTTEKQSRVMEILMISMTPTQMLTGKIIALGLVGLLQTMVWSGAGFLFLRFTGEALQLPGAFQLPASILAWGALFFLLGYAVYASLMAGVGALVPNLREASQATTIMVIPLIIPLILISSLINDPNSTLAFVLSLFPLTSPVTMMTRLAAGSIPTWQPVLAAVILALTAVIILRAVSGMFRAQHLLSGQEFKLKVFLQALAGRA
ncbi:MAG TPA: ABC transporter permease [Anaerolineaceae bacterium]|nr:ABC transporter permease [Anaerolineaceae bacterium]